MTDDEITYYHSADIGASPTRTPQEGDAITLDGKVIGRVGRVEPSEDGLKITAHIVNTELGYGVVE